MGGVKVVGRPRVKWMGCKGEEVRQIGEKERVG